MFIDTPRGPLHVEVQEPLLPWIVTPETIVFCHGVATDCGIWSGWLPVLAPFYRIVRFDTRGFGRSHSPAVRVDWQMAHFADDILRVAQAVGAARFHLVGESMGGTVCLALACRGDAPIDSLTCVSTSHRGGRIQRVGEWRDRARREGMVAWSDRMMDDRFTTNALSAPARDWFSQTQRRTDMDALLEAADMLVRTDLSDALVHIKVPTLLLAPDSSPFLGLEIPTDIHRLIPDAELAVFPGVRHGLAFSHGMDCAQALLAFLERRLGRRHLAS